MKKSILWAAMAAMALTACNKEEIAAPEEGQNLVYREYTATIEDGASTKVAFGTPGENTIPAYFQDGDEIALTDGTDIYKGTVSVPENGGNTIIKTDVPEEFEPTAAYYPYEAYKDGKLTVPATQTYGSVPVLLQSSDIEGENITFSAAEAGSAVICYTLTGDIAIKKARLYVTDNASLINVKPTYTLNFDESLQLSDSPEKIYFAIEADGNKSLTVELISAKPENALGNSDFSYFRRKTSAIELTTGSVVEMPTLELAADKINDGQVIWKFGSANNGDCGWTLANAGSNTIDGETNAEYAVVTMNNNGSNSFRADLVNKQEFEVNIGTYHYVAIMGDFENIIRNCEFTIPDGAKATSGNISFDLGSFGQWHGKGSANGKTNSPMKTEINGVSVWYYEMLGDFSTGNFFSTLDNTTFPEGNSFQFKMADLKVTNVPDGTTVTSPQYKIYWIGFFNNTSEIQAMIDQTEAAVAGESTPAE